MPPKEIQPEHLGGVWEYGMVPFWDQMSLILCWVFFEHFLKQLGRGPLLTRLVVAILGIAIGPCKSLKWHSCECQNAGFPSRALHSKKMSTYSRYQSVIIMWWLISESIMLSALFTVIAISNRAASVENKASSVLNCFCQQILRTSQKTDLSPVVLLFVSAWFFQKIVSETVV